MKLEKREIRTNSAVICAFVNADESGLTEEDYREIKKLESRFPPSEGWRATIPSESEYDYDTGEDTLIFYREET